MENRYILSGYRYFDTFYLPHNVPHDLIQDWGHKERLTTCHILASVEEVGEVEESGTADLNDFESYSSFGLAMAEILDEARYI